MNRVLRVGVVGIFCACLILLAGYGLKSLRRGEELAVNLEAFPVSGEIKMALELGVMTETFSKEPARGGILRDYHAIDIKHFLPEGDTSYHHGESRILWCYGNRPERALRKDRVLRIETSTTTNDVFLFAVLPREIWEGANSLRIQRETGSNAR